VAAPDAAGVREELRQEMRAAAMRKVQQPGGVQDRVKAWQKANAAALKSGAAVVGATVEVPPSEPTEVLVDVDKESVTEEDRVRIKMRQKAKKRKPSKTAETPGLADGAYDGPGEEDGARGEVDGATHQEPSSGLKPKAKATPKKRIISDEHWMKKRKGKSPPRTTPTKGKVEGSGNPIPKDFLLRTAQNPPVQSKIKDWAMRVEPPEPPKPKKRQTKSEGGFTIDDDALSTGDSSDNSRVKSRRTTDDDIRITLAKTRKPKNDLDDGIRVRPLETSSLPDDGIRVRPLETSSLPDDGIRIKPVRKKEPPDDGIRIRPLETTSLPNDGIRVRPGAPSGGDVSRHPSRERGARVSSTKRDASPSDRIEVMEEPESEVYTPTKRKVSAKQKSRRTVSPTTVTQTDVSADAKSSAENSDRTHPYDYSDVASEIPSTVLGGPKSLADIPFGYSAFSELDLPLGADARNSVKRPKGQRNPSFRAVPNVFKKVVSEGKKIIHDKVDPPKPIVNKPPSIESWLINTVDPFVDSPKPKLKKPSVEKVWAQDTRRRPSETQAQEEPQPKPVTDKVDQENANPKPDHTEVTPKKQNPATPPSTGLKRSRATRSSSSPFKPTQRKPFREQLKDAFRGESGGHKLVPVVYPSCQASEPVQSENEDESDYTIHESRRRSSGSNKRSPSPDPASTVESSILSATTIDDLPKRRPPTNGFHELSTIVSEESNSAYLSDETSTVSQTTLTQTTATTKSTANTESTGLSRERSRKSGLKRRLTKHSDLVSVLSLPDGQLIAPSRAKSLKSSHSLRRNASKPNGVSAEDLLDEFADDEHFYRKELKTLVDGVIPVLLTQVVHGEETSSPTGAVGRSPAPAQKAKAMAKAVVNMGVVLEELKDLHKRVPMSDIRSLLTWLQSVQPVYDNYLDVWRLGFEDLIVNLAPASGKPDDEDSLVNAMPRNEEGDVLDHDGERVDVAQLLKRPIIRIKWVVKFLTVC
jgi:hypothetical protein